MALGLIFRDSLDNRTELEYSVQVPPTAPTTYKKVTEVRSISFNPTAATDIDVTHFDSTTKEFKTGFTDPGTVDVVCNFIPTGSAGSPGVPDAHSEIIALSISGQHRHWRITFPKVHSTSTSQAAIGWFGPVATAVPDPGDTETAMSFNFTLRIAGNYFYSYEDKAP